jgi:hypothetical protein
MLGSKDCMYWETKIVLLHRWGNTKDMTSGAQSSVASQDLWIWHSLFGMAGSYNNINVL